jgi:diguanylate cyclase (GGDEF)-like protein
MPLFYLWPVLQAAYFLDRRRLGAVVVTMLVSYAVALQFSPPALRTAYFLAVVVCATLVGAVVSHLKERVNGLLAGLDAAASTDPLTGLLNRRAFEAAFETELSRARRHGRPLTLAVFDLDHFKNVNDHFGHDVGDMALCRTAATLDEGRRSSDVVARVGGEEFAILFVDADERSAHVAAARIAERLGQWPDADVVHLSLSAGVAELGGALRGRVDLMRAADAALYTAKAGGRRRVVSHDGQVTLTGEPIPDLTAESRTLTPSRGT